MPAKTMQQILVEVGQKQAALFHQNNVVYIDCLVKYKTIRTLMVAVYNSLVFNKKIDRIENLLIEEKAALFESAKDFAKETLDTKQMINLCKSLYTLEYLLN
jgi:hypothetical protein